MRQAQARQSTEAGKEDGSSSADTKGRGGHDTRGPLWSALSTATDAVHGSVQRKCAACEESGTPCAECAEEDEEAHRAVQRKASCTCGGRCPACRARAKAASGAGGRPGLEVGPADDRYERQADAVARRVVRMSRGMAGADGSSLRRAGPPVGSNDSRLQRRCSACAAGPGLDDEVLRSKSPGGPVQRSCPSCASRAMSFDDDGVQRSVSPEEPGLRLDRVQRVVDAPGHGKPVSLDVRSRTEPVLGADLSDVRVHSDARAQRAARDIGARAFTHGGHVFLGAGQSTGDLGLMAHELTHTVQQGASPALRRAPAGSMREPAGDVDPTPALRETRIQRIDFPSVDLPSAEDVWEGVTEAGRAVQERGEEAWEWGSEQAGEVYERGSELAERGAEVAGEAYEWGSERAGRAWSAASGTVRRGYEMVSGFARDVWDAAHSLARTLGGAVSITGTRLVVTVPSFPACPTIPLQFTLPELAVRQPILRGVLPVAEDMVVLGNVSLTTGLIPEVSLQLGPCRVHGLRVEVDPLGARWSASGRVSVSSAVGLGAEVGVGARAQVTALVLIPGSPPLPVRIPDVGLELGVSGQVRGIATQTLEIGASASGDGPSFRADLDADQTLGMGLDLGLGAYGLIDVLGVDLCRFHEPFARDQRDTALRLGVRGHLAVSPLSASASLAVDELRVVPFGEFPLAFSREVLADDCGRLEALCQALYNLGWMPSQSGGSWWGHPSGPWPEGPLDVLPRDPSQVNPDFAAGSECRGACGPDCWTCSSGEDRVECVPRPAAGGGQGHDLWVYPDYTTCGTHEGCREHDACYDHCAQGGSRWGPGLCARLCDMECACNFQPGDCLSWIVGGEPHDGRMVFSNRPYVASSCDIPCPQGPGGSGGGAGIGGGGSGGGAASGGGGNGSGGGGAGGGWSGGGGSFGGGGASSSWGGGSGGGGGAGSSWGGGDASSYVICLPTLELFARKGVSDAWEAETPFYPIWSKWIVAPPPVLLVSLKLGLQGSANASVGAGIGPATVNDVCFAVDLEQGTYEATGAVNIEADFSARLAVGGELCVIGSWIELLEVVSGCVGLEATGTLSARADLGGVLRRRADLTCSSGAPTLDTDLAFSLAALLDFDMDVTFRLNMVGGIEVYSTRWDLIQAQWRERWGQDLDVDKNPLGDPTIDLRSHRFGLEDLGRLLEWLLSDEAEATEAGEEDEERTVVEDPLTAARARTIPDLASKLDDPQHHSQTLTLVGGASSVAGRSMISRHITDDTAMGSGPGGQSELYGYGRLPTTGDMGGAGYSKEMYFIRGHLLNYHASRGLGGEGAPRNLYPITAKANQDHNTEVEESVKGLVHDDHLVVLYQVQVANVDGPHRFDAFDDDPDRECVYEYINADFVCEYATYRLYSDDTVELNDPVRHTVDEDFDESAFRDRMEEKGCPGK